MTSSPRPGSSYPDSIDMHQHIDVHPHNVSMKPFRRLFHFISNCRLEQIHEVRWHHAARITGGCHHAHRWYHAVSAVGKVRVCLQQPTRATWGIHTHTHPFNGPSSRTTQVSRYQKVKPIWTLLKQETVSGSGISWAIRKSAPRSRQITMPAPHH